MSNVDNTLRANHKNSQIWKRKLNNSETDKYRLSNKNPKPATSNETFENIFKVETEIETDVLMEKNDWEDLSSKKTQTKDGKNLLSMERTKTFSKNSKFLTHLVA